MSSNIPNQQFNLDYTKLISEYKKEYFKKMPILHHEFLYACFHPSLEDCVIALERNYYPYDSELYGLAQSPESFYQKIIKNLEEFKSHDKLKRFAQLIGFNENLQTEISDEELEEDPDFNSNKTNLLENINTRIKNVVAEKIQQKEKVKSKDFNSILSIEKMTQKLKENFISKVANDTKVQKEEAEGLNNASKWQGSFLRNNLINKQERFIKKQTMYLSGELKKQQNTNSPVGLKEEEDKSPQGKTDSQHGTHQKEEFRFQEPKQLFEQKLDTSNIKKYGISIWKINRGNQAFQLREYTFNMDPVGKKFYASHNGQQILVYLGSEPLKANGRRSLGGELSSVLILNSDTLDVIKEFSPQKELNLRNQQIFDSALIWNCTFLYIQCFADAYFIDLKNPNKVTNYSLLYDHFEKNNRQQSQTFTSKKLQHALFKENEPGFFYGVIESHKQKTLENGKSGSETQTYEMVRVSLESENIFLSSNYFQSISKSRLEYNGTIAYNKDLTQIVFPGEQVFYLFNLPIKNNQASAQQQPSLQPIKSVQNCQVNKNSFLRDFIWITYNDDNYETFTSSTENLAKKYSLSQFDLDDFSLGDTIIERHKEDQDQYVISIGRNNSKDSSTSSRFCMNTSKINEPSIEPDQINYINELSEFICVYPFLVFCKGNCELFIQSLHNPKKLVKLDLQDQFLCFVDFNQNLDHKPGHIAMGMRDGSQCFRKYETIAFLTQKGQKIHLNILEYKLPFGGDEVCKDPLHHNHPVNQSCEACDQLGVKMNQQEQYLFYRSATTIVKPQMSYGSILKAVFSKVKHKECKDHDYVLILQFRNTILIRSFYNLYHLNTDKFIFRFPLIFLASKKKTRPDLTFFVSKDGYSTKIERVCFNDKDMKESPITTVFELKTQNVFIFNYNNGFFYLMDDSMTLKQFQYERRTQKLKYIKTFDFAVENKDLLSQNNQKDFDVQVTERGIYKGVLFIPFYDSTIYNKNHSMIKPEAVLNIKSSDDLFEGPIKLYGTQYILYIARENKEIVLEEDYDDTSDENTSQENETIRMETIQRDTVQREKENNNIEEESEPSNNVKEFHNVPNPSHSKQIKDQTSRLSNDGLLGPSEKQSQMKFDQIDVEEIKLVASLKRSPTITPTNSKNTTFKKQSTMSFNQSKFFQSKPTKKDSSIKQGEFLNGNQQQSTKSINGIMNQINSQKNKSLYQSEIHNEEDQVFAWIVPFLDSNVLHLTHNRKENNNPQYEITFSTFLNTHDQILCLINQVFYVFTKNGTFLYEVNVLKGDSKDPFYFLKYGYKIQHVSNNLQYFVFHNQEAEKFQVFKLVSQHGVVPESQSQNKSSKMFGKASIFLSQLKKKKELEQLIYSFVYVKEVNEIAKIYNQEDYFHQRHVSSQGLVFQLIMQEKVPVEQEPAHQRKVPHSKMLKRKKTIYQSSPMRPILKKQTSKEEKLQGRNYFDDYNPSEEKIINTFQFFIDNREITEFNSKFLLIQDHLNTKDNAYDQYMKFGFKVIGQYLFIRKGNELEYMQIFNFEEESVQVNHQDNPAQNEQQQNFDFESSLNKRTHKATQLNLKFDKGVDVLRVMSTVRNDLIQIIASDERFMFVITWDILKNMEHSMIQIENKFNFSAAHIVCKGMSEKLNYIPINNGIYDLNYSLPFTFFQNVKVSSSQKPKMSLNERKLSRFNKEYLDILDNNKVYLSYTLLDLCYMKALCQVKEDKLDQSHILLQHLSFRINGLTIFHEFALNKHFLELIYSEVIKVEEQKMMNTSSSNQEKDQMGSYKILFLSLLYPNFYNNTAFDHAMMKKSPKSIEIMLSMLTQLPLYSISKWIMPHFSELLSMDLTSFNDFMTTCQFQQPKMREIRMIKWPYKEDEYYIDFHTSYLGNYFHHLLQKINPKKHIDEGLEAAGEKEKQSELVLQTQDFTLFELVDGQMSENQNLMGKHLRIYDGKLNKKGSKKKLDQSSMERTKTQSFDQDTSQQMKRVELNAVEFDWVFKGQMAVDFIQHLATTENDTLFTNPTIKIIILFLWQKFFFKIRNKVFYPFIAYFFCYIMLTTVAYEKKIILADYLNGTDLNEGSNATVELLHQWTVANNVFLVICLIGWLYFFYIEIYQMTFFRLAYFKQFWNYIDMASLITNLAFFIVDVLEVDHQRGRVLSSLSIFLIYIKAFYFLRLFSPTAAFMRMILQICLDMRVFVLIWFFAIIAFSNATFILSQNLDYDVMMSMDQNSYFQAFLYNYMIELGSFATSTYNGNQNQSLWWIIFLVQSLLVQIVFLNLLIAIMTDTFDRVQSTKVESKLREICKLIAEYEYSVNREKMFRNSKYIIVASVEKAETTSSEDWSGRIQALKGVIVSQLQEVKRDNKQSNENLKEELIANNKLIDQKFMDLQSFVMKQLALVLKKMDNVGEKVGQVMQFQQEQQKQQQIQNSERREFLETDQIEKQVMVNSGTEMSFAQNRRKDILK